MRLYEHIDVFAFKVATIAAGGAAVATPDWATGVFGVPLTVIFAALFGALGAVSLMEETTKRKALTAVGFGLGFGTFLSPIVGQVLHTQFNIPLGFDRGIAFALGLAPWWLPMAVNWFRTKTGANQ